VSNQTKKENIMSECFSLGKLTNMIIVRAINRFQNQLNSAKK